MKDLFGMIRRLARRMCVCAVTANRDGKELVARALHSIGPRRDRDSLP